MAILEKAKELSVFAVFVSYFIGSIIAFGHAAAHSDRCDGLDDLRRAFCHERSEMQVIGAAIFWPYYVSYVMWGKAK